MIGRIQIKNKNVEKSSIFCQGTKEITAIVDSGRPVVRQSAIHNKFRRRVNDHVIAARCQYKHAATINWQSDNFIETV